MNTEIPIASALTATALIVSAAALASTLAGTAGPPSSRREPVTDQLHGVTVADPYRWLENVDSPAVQEWMRAQDTYARERLTSLPGREGLETRFKELLYVDVVSAPRHRGTRYFYTHRKAKQEKGVLCWKEGDKGTERVLIDPNTLSADGSVSLGGWSPSYDGKFVAYLLHKNNSDAATLYIRDIDAGKDLEKDIIADAKYASPSWTPDSKGFYYTWLPTDPSISASDLPGYAEVRYHARGSDPATDTIVHPALHDPTQFLGGYLSRDGRFLIVEVQHGWTSNDVFYKDLQATAETRAPVPSGEKAGASHGRGKSAAARQARSAGGRVKSAASERAPEGSAAAAGPAAPKGVSPTELLGFRPLTVGREALYSTIPWRGSFYVTTNEGAPLFRIFKVDPARPERSAWREIVRQGDAPIDSTQIVGEHLIVNYLRKATSQPEVRDLSGKLVRKIELPGIGSVSGLVGNPDEDDAYFSFTSFTQPPEIFRTSVKRGGTSVWEKIEIPVDTSVFVADQVFYPSKDGTKVSMFIVHRKDMKRTGDNPVFLTGYGGFNVSETPGFSTTAVVWLEHGGVFALPNLRGGAEYGEDWHRAGMLTKKQNVFDDFIAAAEYLVKERYTRPDKLAIIGGSNGGLLVGAAMVQRPDLFGAVVCAVPLLDMVRYHKFGSGQTWVSEYGSAEDPELFRALYAYSPYHHVSETAPYPPTLIMSADSDDRVDPMHARKFAAALQWAASARVTPPAEGTEQGDRGGPSPQGAQGPSGITSEERPVLLRIERHAGHGGADLIKQRVQQQVDEFAFLFDQLGVN